MPTLDLAAVERAADALFAPDAPHGIPLALVVMQAGDVVFERYGEQPDTPFGPGGYEIAELAGALNTVQSSAADLAGSDQCDFLTRHECPSLSNRPKA